MVLLEAESEFSISVGAMVGILIEVLRGKIERRGNKVQKSSLNLEERILWPTGLVSLEANWRKPGRC